MTKIPDHIRGDTFNGRLFTIINSTDPDALVPIDLTGATIRMQLRRSPTSNVVFQIQVGAGITITNAMAGQFKINEQIIDIEPGDYFYDIEFTIDNVVKTWVRGTWKIIADITRWKV